MDTKISALTAGAAVAGTEVIPGVQSGVNVKITADQIKTYVNSALGSYASVGGPMFYYPNVPGVLYSPTSGTALATATKRAVIGRARIDGLAASKTVSSAGGKIHFLLSGTPTFVNAGSSIAVGIQDVDTATGPSGRPDGTFDVSKTLVGNATPPIATGWNSIALDTGSKTINNGDLIAVVFDVTLAGADVASLTTFQSNDNNYWPQSNTYSAGVWGTTSGIPVICMIEADDGTKVIIEGVPPVSANTQEQFSASTNPKERGSVIRVPWACKVSGYKINGLYITDANSDFKVSLYSDPFGTPALVTGSQVTVLAETAGRATQWGNYIIPLPAELTLAKDTDYALVVEATGTTNVRMLAPTFANAAYKRLCVACGDNYKKVYRNGTGVFTADATMFEQVMLEISQIFTV